MWNLRVLAPLLMMLLTACNTLPQEQSIVAGSYHSVAVNHVEVTNAAQAAIAVQAEKTKQPMSVLEVLEAKQQVVSGINYELLLSVQAGDQVRRVKAVVWWQAWSPTPYQLQSWTWLN